ncbi:MAG: hypothetical protein KGI97_07370 [Alphaproteobacteria bacterium]|nr:hypothetical protein [Alphaproteobacteria bacterium]
MTNLLPRFNIAAVPVDEDLREDFYRAAASLEAFADGYCLARGQALPHATLCQFRAADAASALRLVKGFAGEEIELQNTGLHIRKGEAEHSGTFWIEYAVACAPRLMDLQTRIVGHLQKNAVEIFNKKNEGYHPHFTLVRTEGVLPRFDATALFDRRLVGDAFPCRLWLGLSDENGQFLKILGPS